MNFTRNKRQSFAQYVSDENTIERAHRYGSNLVNDRNRASRRGNATK